MDKENNVVTNSSGSRASNFFEIPATEVYSLYFQDNISLRKENAYYLLKLGARYDNMLKKYNLLSPRLSASAKFFDKYRVRAAYGVSYRAPSVSQLHPAPNYFDVINLNHYSSEEIRSLAVATTYIYQPVNDHIEPSKGTTYEVGIDYENNGYSFLLTGFHKELKNGIVSVSQLLSFDKRIWESTGEIPGQATVVVPTDDVVRISSSFTGYRNTVTTKTNGLEYSMQFPKIKATNTTINLSGSFLWTERQDESLALRSSISFSSSPQNRYGLYEKPTYLNLTGRSTLTIAQHFPEIRMLLTFRTEISWIKKQEVSVSPSPYALAFYELDGSYHEIPEDERASSKYENLRYPVEYLNQSPEPTYFNFHLQLRKEMKQGHTFSFFVNNFLWYNPSYKNNINQNLFLNSRVTFGVGLNFKI